MIYDFVDVFFDDGVNVSDQMKNVLMFNDIILNILTKCLTHVNIYKYFKKYDTSTF